MSEKTRDELKSYFQSGKRPTGQQFADLIDSVINKLDDGIGIDGGNNVGIGTANPHEKLHVNGTATITGDIGITDDSIWKTGQHTLELQNNDAGDVALSFHRAGYTNAFIKHPTTGGLTLSGNGGFDSEHLHIKSDGRIGVGTISPDEKLHVNGTATITADIGITDDAIYKTGQHTLELQNNDAGDVALSFHRAGYTSASIKHSAVGGLTLSGNGAFDSEHLHIKSDGKVGIGTITPGVKLHVKGDGTVHDIISAENGGISIKGGNSVSHSLRFDDITGIDRHLIYIDSSNDVRIGNSNFNTILYEDQDIGIINGNFGIGTHSPDFPLHVKSPGSGNVSWFESSNGDAVIKIKTGETNSAKSAIHFGDSNHNHVGSITYDHSVDALTFDTDNASRLTIDSDGNVGIGTLSPDEKLHVNGTVTITADIGITDDSIWKTGQHTLELQNNDAGDVALSFHRAGYTNASIKHGTTGGLTLSGNGAFDSEHLHIKSDGRIGVGTNTPEPGSSMHMYQNRYTLYGPNTTWGAYLQVGGNGRQTTHASVATTSGNLHIDSADGPYRTHINYYSQAHTIINALAGNVGIGTGNPTQKLHVVGDALKTAGGASWQNPSDKRLKKDIKPFTDSLELLKKVQPVTYRYNGKAGIQESGEEVGVIAQEIREVFPYMVSAYKAKLNASDTEDSDILSFNGSVLKFVMLNAIKELDETIKERDQTIDIINETVKNLHEANEKLNKTNKKQEEINKKLEARLARLELQSGL